MFLHELSRSISQSWKIKVDGREYENLVRKFFQNHCPYCSCSLSLSDSVIEHLDGMNRCRGGLHVPGNVLVTCRRCNSEKRRDDSLRILRLAPTGWESFLSHDGTRCVSTCPTCRYWESVWKDVIERREAMSKNLQRIRTFRGEFAEFQAAIPSLAAVLPGLLTKLYSDCQNFAESEIKALLSSFNQPS